jgi:glucose/mannose-6-phosphate isomerase
VPVIGVPAGMQPRAAVVYMVVGVLECAAACGAAPGLHAEIDTAPGVLEQVGREPLAQALAQSLQGTVPVIHGAGPTAAVARRWKTQINENAESAAFWSKLPEANHNEICGWERGRKLAPFSGVFLEDPDQHPRVQRRIELTAAEVERSGAPALRVAAPGDTRLDRVMSLVMLGDLVSVHLARLDGVDPTPVEAIERFKGALAQP